MNDEAIEELIVSKEEANQRLDKYLVEKFPHFSRQYFQYLIREKLVLVGGELVKKAALLKEGDEIEIEFAATEEISLEPEDIPLDILYEDEDILLINKPSSMVVHPAAGNWSHTFVNALIFHCKHLHQPVGCRPGIVHRLDKDTTGVLLAAKNETAQKRLVNAFVNREIEKEYLAVCLGNPSSQKIENSIGRHPVKRKEMAVVKEKGKKAVTFIQNLASHKGVSLVRCIPITGRTHQIRVHLKSVGCPILGDKIYGNEAVNRKYKAERQYLHAHRLSFYHPIMQQKIDIKAPLAEDMSSFIKKCFGKEFSSFESGT